MMTLIQEKISQLQHDYGVSAVLCDLMAHHFEHEPAPGLTRLSSHQLADKWGVPRLEVLEAFLYATRLGILDLAWVVRCPSCRELVVGGVNLQHLKPEATCGCCQIDIEAAFDELVEITFNVNRNIRQYDQPKWRDLYQYWQWYTPHILPFTVPAHTTLTYPLTLTPGAYQLHRAPYIHYTVPIAVTESVSDTVQEIYILNNDEDIVRRDKIFHHAGQLNLNITNESDQPVELMISRYNQYPWVTAAQVASCQIFRDLFATELISEDESFGVQNIVFMFTDIKGSTELYEQLGDSQAYYLVKKHFKILTDKIRRHNGAIVKTIGDAVMATFTVSTDAIQAILAAQQAFDEFNAQEHTRDNIIIKVGAHRGPCIAVTSNDRLDYFGRTVNLAARIQGLSAGQDIVLSQTLYDEPAVRHLISQSAWQTRHFQASLKGIENLYNVVQLTPPKGVMSDE